MVELIGLITDRDEVRRIYEFIKAHPLDYPNYADWIEKCRRQLELEEKGAIYEMSDGRIIGCIVYQQHREDRHCLEIKNFRVDTHHRHSGVGTRLEQRICRIARASHLHKVYCDVSPSNQDMITFLLNKGYILEDKEPLYTRNRMELIFSKFL